MPMLSKSELRVKNKRMDMIEPRIMDIRSYLPLLLESPVFNSMLFLQESHTGKENV